MYPGFVPCSAAISRRTQQLKGYLEVRKLPEPKDLGLETRPTVRGAMVDAQAKVEKVQEVNAISGVTVTGWRFDWCTFSFFSISICFKPCRCFFVFLLSRFQMQASRP